MTQMPQIGGRFSRIFLRGCRDIRNRVFDKNPVSRLSELKFGFFSFYLSGEADGCDVGPDGVVADAEGGGDTVVAVNDVMFVVNLENFDGRE